LELTARQKEILARLEELYEAQTASVMPKTSAEAERHVITYAELLEYEKRAQEIDALHRELIESAKPPA
jgi:transcription initiation factor IIE alpha subunit